MYNVTIEKFSIVFRDSEGQKHILLDGDHTVRNVSRIPIQIFDNNVTWAEKLVEIQEKYELLSRGTEEHNADAFLVNCILTNYLVEKVKPAKVVEIGCTSGLLSWSLIQLLHVFHEDSSLCCVTDAIGNCSNDIWLARVNDSANLIRNELAISILIRFNELFNERKYAQVYHMFHVNVWMKKVMGSNHYDILGKCFEIYKLELEHGKETTIFDSVDSYQEAVEEYEVLKYMLRRIEYDVAEEIIDRLIPYFVEHSISAEYLSYLIKCECFDTDKVVNAWEALVNLYQKEHKREL